MSEPSSDLFYKHSGKTGLSVPAILLIGLPLIAVLSAVYSAVVVYCPIVGYVNILFLGAYLFAGGFMLATLARFAKCRSPGILCLLGLTTGLVGLYFAWVFFIAMLYGDEAPPVLDLALNPIKVYAAASAINAQGWWGPSGIAQWALVGVEAVIIVGGLALFAAAAIDREVFCEDCNTWCESFETMHLRMGEEIINAPTDQLKHLELLALRRRKRRSIRDWWRKCCSARVAK